MLDLVVDRRDLKATIARVLRFAIRAAAVEADAPVTELPAPAAQQP